VTTRTDAGAPHRARRLRPGRAGSAIALGAVLLLLAGGLGWRLTRGVEEFGAGTGLGPATSVQARLAADAGVPVAAGRLPGTPAVPPLRLEIPAIKVTAPVDAVGLDQATGEVDLPRDVDTVGWYRYGPDLGSTAGSVTIAGHVDGAAQGKGAFFRLREVPAGARVVVFGSDGAPRSFTVVSREVFAKTAMPMDRLFARDGRLRLTLITCGGPFDRKTRHYRDNVVLTAVPIGVFQGK